MQEIVPMNCSIYEQQFLVECEIRRKNRIFSGPIDTLWLKKNFQMPPYGVITVLSEPLIDFAEAANWPGCPCCGTKFRGARVYWQCTICTSSILNCAGMDSSGWAHCSCGNSTKSFYHKPRKVPIVQKVAVAAMQLTAVAVWRG
jgi:hypothetical protein